MRTKLTKIWRAFCTGFWNAWYEIPPARYQKQNIGELTVKINCDTSDFDAQVRRVIEELNRIQQRQSTMMAVK